MTSSDDSLVFTRITSCINKPRMRFALASGRSVELVEFHLTPAWTYTGSTPRFDAQETASRLFPNETPHFVGDFENGSASAFLCCAYFYSDKPVGEGAANYSLMLLCMLVENAGASVRNIVSSMLSDIDWDSMAHDDVMW